MGDAGKGEAGAEHRGGSPHPEESMPTVWEEISGNLASPRPSRPQAGPTTVVPSLPVADASRTQRAAGQQRPGLTSEASFSRDVQQEPLVMSSSSQRARLSWSPAPAAPQTSPRRTSGARWTRCGRRPRSGSRPRPFPLPAGPAHGASLRLRGATAMGGSALGSRRPELLRNSWSVWCPCAGRGLGGHRARAEGGAGPIS
mmetsp:Transcript_16523/g.39199  ORF Transcript_16523/g.39199 Transcript_16523/m.39199 type:complete len:200 (+) Transcript_16523:311-910(+)